MKKNAILIAAIAFVAGCAHQQGGYVRSDYDAGYSYQENEARTSQAPMMTTETVVRDPQGRVIVEDDPPVALQYDPATEEGFGGPATFESGASMETDLKADSSERGGSLRARGVELSGSQSESPVVDRINPLYEADSSQRGTSIQARGYQAGEEETTIRSSSGVDLEADSSERGGSLQAQTEGRPFGEIQSEVTLEDENFSTSDRQQLQTSTTYEETDLDSEVNLNTSDHLEANMSGEYDLDARVEDEGVGRAAGSETAQRRSNDTLETDEQNLEGIERDSALLYESNPAHGVGSATAPNTAANAAAIVEAEDNSPDGKLARQVKQRLARESTGTYGMTSPMVARNVQVSSEGGVVTLKGTVPTQRDKEVLTIRAREIPGVQEVKNEIKVSSRESREPAPATAHGLEEIHDTTQE